jgi:ubiquinone/menaquinone biosynthesis C-methylase UbiE
MRGNIMEYIKNHYSNYDEEARFDRKHNLVEYLTTLRYIQKYIKPNSYVLEVGAGTGRYSRAIADMGNSIEAVELTPHNIKIFKQHVTPKQNIRITEGNALDLSMFENETFDITLLLGPLYHLYTEEDKKQAISEALRVTKTGGIVFAAYCINDLSLLDAFRNGGNWIPDYLDKGKIDPVTFDTTSVPEDIFELVRKDDIDRIMLHFNVERLHYVATDMVSRLIRDSLANMADNVFDIYLRFHYAVCERPDMVGTTMHSLDIFRKT